MFIIHRMFLQSECCCGSFVRDDRTASASNEGSNLSPERHASVKDCCTRFWSCHRVILRRARALLFSLICFSLFFLVVRRQTMEIVRGLCGALDERHRQRSKPVASVGKTKRKTKRGGKKKEKKRKRVLHVRKSSSAIEPNVSPNPVLSTHQHSSSAMAGTGTRGL